jgi:putative hydrolases of HD superfamily
MSEYDNIIIFMQEIERLKDITRTAWTSGGRRESVAEHSWRLSMFVLAIADYFPEIDLNRAIRMCLVHDLGEAYEGDISAKIESDPADKLKREETALERLLASLPESTRQNILTLCREYNRGESEEAKLAKALDKMETIIQHNQGDNPDDFDYGFNLQYGEKYTHYHPVIRAIRDLIDQETLHRISNHDNQQKS